MCIYLKSWIFGFSHNNPRSLLIYIIYGIFWLLTALIIVIIYTSLLTFYLQWVFWLLVPIFLWICYLIALFIKSQKLPTICLFLCFIVIFFISTLRLLLSLLHITLCFVYIFFILSWLFLIIYLCSKIRSLTVIVRWCFNTIIYFYVFKIWFYLNR